MLCIDGRKRINSKSNWGIKITIIFEYSFQLYCHYMYSPFINSANLVKIQSNPTIWNWKRSNDISRELRTAREIETRPKRARLHSPSLSLSLSLSSARFFHRGERKVSGRQAGRLARWSRASRARRRAGSSESRVWPVKGLLIVCPFAVIFALFKRFFSAAAFGWVGSGILMRGRGWLLFF